MSKTTDSISSTCVLCCQSIKIYAVGPCDHHICYKCSTKMRVLCDQKYCAVCRTDMAKVIFTQKLHPYQGIISHKFPIDRKYGVAFATSKVQEEFRRLQDHRCSVCPAKRLPENTFRDLQDHLRKEHEMFYCELCLKHLQIFTHERKCYNRRNLAMHKRKGDPDDTSYRGHPLCEFCDDRYFDNDELLKHLRRQHYFCHFCETDGASNQYYNDYADLKYHFGEEHYLCDNVECAAEEFTHAFRTEIDLKAHRAKVHSKNMTRAQAKQARQIDIEVNLPPRPRDNRGGLGGPGRGRGRRYERYNDNSDTARAVQASVETARQEEHARDQEESSRNDRKARKVEPKSKDKKASISAVEGRRSSWQEESGSGKSSPVPMESRKEETGAKHATTKTRKEKEESGGKQAVKSTKASKDDNKENQRKDKKNISASTEVTSSSRGASNVSSAKKPVKKEKEKLPDFPSLSTFKPLTDETVTPSWGGEATLSSISSSLSSSVSKETGKKKKKKKKDSSFTIEEPESDLNLQGGVINMEVDKKSKTSEKPSQPMWNLIGSSASSTNSPSTASTTTKQPPSSWATNSSPTANASLSQPTWPAPTSLAPKGSTPQSEWPGSISSNKNKPVSNSTWTNKSSTPNVANSSDFPTLSSIASLLGGSGSLSGKKQKENRSANKKKENPSGVTKQTDSKKKPLPSKSWNQIAEPEKSTVSEAPTKTISKKGQGGISDGPKPPPPGLSLAPSNDVIHRAPPGFSQGPKNAPPPGFAPVNLPVNSVPPDPHLNYIQPTNYTARNFTLLEKIKTYLQHDESKLMIFKTVSGEFRRSNITPAEYYGHCLELLGDNLPSIFSELVSLLPDVVKQQELLEAANSFKVQQKQKKVEKVLKISESKGQTNRKASSKAWGNTAEHSTCTQCGQIMLSADMEAHLNSHQDFPSLTASVGPKSKAVMAPSSWARIK